MNQTPPSNRLNPTNLLTQILPIHPSNPTIFLTPIPFLHPLPLPFPLPFPFFRIFVSVTRLWKSLRSSPPPPLIISKSPFSHLSHVQISSEDCVYGEHYFHPSFYVSHGEMATSILSTCYKRFFSSSFQPSERISSALSFKRAVKPLSLQYQQSIWDEEAREAIHCIPGYEFM